METREVGVSDGKLRLRRLHARPQVEVTTARARIRAGEEVTQSRIVGDHYEVKMDGVWTPVPYDKINNVIAPDGGAHVCAPRQVGPNKGVIFCVILPSEG
jgi:hypothetical protein